MKDFEVTIGIRNNRIKERRMSLGMSQAQLATAVGIYTSNICSYETFHDSPVLKKIESGGPDTYIWKTSAQKLANFFDVKPEELWPEALKIIKKSKAVIRVDAEEVYRLFATGDEEYKQLLPAQDELISNAELHNELIRMLKTLTPHEQSVIELRFGLKSGDEHTLESVGFEFGVDKERIRQIEAKAFRKLRNLSGSKILRSHLSTDDKLTNFSKYSKDVEQWEERCKQVRQLWYNNKPNG